MSPPNGVERRSGTGKPPTWVIQWVTSLPEWKRAIMFAFGLAGAGVVLIRFFVLDAGHDHSTPEILAHGAALLVCLWVAFPIGVTQMVDKYLPAKWRNERRSNGGETDG